MLIGDFTYTVETSPCDSTASHLRAIATLETDISAVLPYLNAEFPDSEYYPDAKTIRVRSAGRTYVVRSDSLLTGVAHVDEAHGLFAHIRDVINGIWSRRDQITPDHTKRERVPVLTLFKGLPRTNCRKCGQASCMAFAAQLSARAAHLDTCPELDARARAELAGLLSQD